MTGARGVLGRAIMGVWQDVNWLPFPGDIRSVEEVRCWLAEARPLDGIVHLAALVPTAQVEADPHRAFQTNVAGTCHLLEALRSDTNRRRPWMFFASTSHVYRSSSAPLGEDAPFDPITLYGRTKLQAEEWCGVYAARHGQPLCIGRIFSYASPLQAPSYFVPATITRIRSATRGATIEIPGLHGTRDFLATSEIGRAIRFLFTSQASGTFNIASGTGQRLLEVAERIRARLGRDDVRIVPTATGTTHLVADVSRLNAAGLRLRFDLDELLREMGL